MKNNLPFFILFILPMILIMGISSFQYYYWFGSKSGIAKLSTITETKAGQFNPGDVRRASITELNVVFTDDRGQAHKIRQLSPLTKYFYKYNDTLNIRYFNKSKFEGTIWNFPIKFYYVIIAGGYLVLSGLMVYLTSLRTKKRQRT